MAAHHVPDDRPVLTVSAAAALAGMHAQTLRQYDRLGLVVAARTRGGGRRYSMRDVETLQEIQRLSLDEGINLSGIKRILDLEEEVRELRAKVEHLKAALEPGSRVFSVSPTGSVITVTGSLRRQRQVEDQPQSNHRRALVLWRPNPY